MPPKKVMGAESAVPPEDFAQTVPPERKGVDSWFVMIETGKIMGQMDRLIKGHDDLNKSVGDHVGKVDGLMWKAIAAFGAVFAAGFLLACWANTRFETADKNMSELNKNVAVMQTQMSEMQENVQDIKAAVTAKK